MDRCEGYGGYPRGKSTISVGRILPRNPHTYADKRAPLVSGTNRFPNR